MKILKTLTLRGPNYWSIRRNKLIVMRVDLEDLAEKSSVDLPGFSESLVNLLPILREHFCSPGYQGGFLERLNTGTYMGHIIEHVALSLQEMADLNVGFGRTRETSTAGVYNVVFEYTDEQAGRYAGRAAVRICRSIVDNGRYLDKELIQDIEDIKHLSKASALGMSTETIVEEAQSRKIPWMALSSREMIQLGYGFKQKRLQATLSQHSSILGVELACDKEGTKTILKEAGIPVPQGVVIEYRNDLPEAIEEVGGYPIVIKPLDGNHGRGITINITTLEDAQEAYAIAKSESKNRSVILERYYKGSDHRVLVVNGKVVAVAQRVPAFVKGDGKSTIEQLVERTNTDPSRGIGHDNVLTKITIDRTSIGVLQRQGYNLDTILPNDEIAYLKDTANLSTGGIAIDRTDEIHSENIWIAERAVKLIGLDIGGIDIVTPDISKPLREVDGVIVEINAAPGFRMHVAPSQGQPRNVAAAVLDMLFPEPDSPYIPIVAITGTNGKTTTSRLIAHIFTQSNKVVGLTTTDGIYIGQYLVEQGDNTGPQSASVILKDPTVEVAVLESARGGILRSGLAFEQCDVGVVLNVAADHLGLGDIDTIEQMAKVKSVIAEVVKSDNGYAVLNAEDPLVSAMAKKVKGKVAYFSLTKDNPIIKQHLLSGGIAAIYHQGNLSIWRGIDTEYVIDSAINVPVTLKGMAPFMIANALAACLAAFVQGVDIETIKIAVNSFKLSQEQTPGRMNLFDLGNYHILLDYAHNPAGYEAVGVFVKNWNSGERVGIVGGPGDRRNEDLFELGRLSATIFDKIIVKEDLDRRGREPREVADIIAKGILSVKPNADYQIILNEIEALEIAVSKIKKGDLIVIFPESVTCAIKAIKDKTGYIAQG